MYTIYNKSMKQRKVDIDETFHSFLLCDSLILFMRLTFLALAGNFETPAEQYKAYIDSLENWNTCQDHIQKAEMAQIPAHILNQMSTDDLQRPITDCFY